MMPGRFMVLPLLAIVLAGAGTLTEQRTLYRGGRILTLSPDNAIVDAMLVVDGRIVATGSARDADSWLTPGTRSVDLAGRHVLPGFVDAHSHFPSSGIREVTIDLSAPPIGTVASRDEVLARIADAVTASGDQWLLGFNYDNAAFADGRHPTRLELDAISGDHPVYLWHSSGHMGVANTRALQALGIDAGGGELPAGIGGIAGGVVGIDPADGSLTGLLQERAAPSLTRLLGELPLRALWSVLMHARDEYLAAGVTTVQNGYAGASMIRILDWAERLGVLPQRVVVWPAHDKLGAALLERGERSPSRSGLQRGAVKLIADGSPQGLTAALSEPYFHAAGAPPEHAGIAAMKPVELQAWIHAYHRAGYQLAVHGNGDAAIGFILDGIEAAQQAFPRADARHVLVHAQTVRFDQLQRMHSLEVSASFFVAHTYYWGDWHRSRSLGPARASTISPTGWADEIGVRYSLHADTPVTPMLPMQMLWSATQRETLTGVVLGAEQRIDRLRALRALTIDAAWQNHLERSRGSLEPGKLADFIVLSGNPLGVVDVRELQVLQTYVGGREVYRLAAEELPDDLPTATSSPAPP